MKRTFRKLTSAFIAAAMAITALPQAVTAEILPQEAEVLTSGDTGTYNDFEYEELEDGTLSITRYVGSDTEIVIPAEINGKKVTVIEGYTFSGKNSITKITISNGVTTIRKSAFYACSLMELNLPNSLTTIDDMAFDFCESLSQINVDKSNKNFSSVDGVLFNKDITTLIQFPCGKDVTSYVVSDDVTTIGNWAFNQCSSLKEINLPDSLTTIGEGAFFDCSSLKEINLPDSLTTIENRAFESCRSLKKINLPDSLTTVDGTAFTWCDSLTEINASKNNKNLSSIDGVLFNKDATALIRLPGGKTVTSYIIPDGVTTIGVEAFCCCRSLTEITVPDGATTIGNSAFENCGSLKKINLPDSLTTIEEYAFFSCSSLTEINIPNSLTTIGDAAFWACDKLEEINLPDGVTAIGEGTFSNCSSLTEITIPDGVTTIGEDALSYCSSLTEITIPDSVITIGDAAFWGCSSLTKINLPDSLTTIGKWIFYYCTSLSEIIIPDSVTAIGYGAFEYCSSLTEITIPDSVTIIGERAFCWCNLLTKITIPAGVTEIGDDVFYDCPDDLTIYGYTGSYAETYANTEKIPFVSIGLFLNSDSDVSVTADEGVIPGDTQIEVEQTEKTDTSVSYNITLTQDGKEVQPNGNVTVRIPVPEGWDANSIYVYHRDENGRLTEMKATVSDGYIVFTTDHFSEYILTTEKQTTVKLGDVDGNGKINSVDARWVLQAISGKRTLTADQQAAADVNNDGKINTTDAKWILQDVSGKRELE